MKFTSMFNNSTFSGQLFLNNHILHNVRYALCELCRYLQFFLVCKVGILYGKHVSRLRTELDNKTYQAKYAHKTRFPYLFLQTLCRRRTNGVKGHIFANARTLANFSQ